MAALSIKSVLKLEIVYSVLLLNSIYTPIKIVVSESEIYHGASFFKTYKEAEDLSDVLNYR